MQRVVSRSWSSLVAIVALAPGCQLADETASPDGPYHVSGPFPTPIPWVSFVNAAPRGDRVRIYRDDTHQQDGTSPLTEFEVAPDGSPIGDVGLGAAQMPVAGYGHAGLLVVERTRCTFVRVDYRDLPISQPWTIGPTSDCTRLYPTREGFVLVEDSVTPPNQVQLVRIDQNGHQLGRSPIPDSTTVSSLIGPVTFDDGSLTVFVPVHQDCDATASSASAWKAIHLDPDGISLSASQEVVSDPTCTKDIAFRPMGFGDGILATVRETDASGVGSPWMLLLLDRDGNQRLAPTILSGDLLEIAPLGTEHELLLVYQERRNHQLVLSGEVRSEELAFVQGPIELPHRSELAPFPDVPIIQPIATRRGAVMVLANVGSLSNLDLSTIALVRGDE